MLHTDTYFLTNNVLYTHLNILQQWKSLDKICYIYDLLHLHLYMGQVWVYNLDKICIYIIADTMKVPKICKFL